MDYESIVSAVASHDAFQAAVQKATLAGDIMNKLPPGSFVAGGLFLSWLFNRYLTDRALNNGNSPARYTWAKEIIVVTGGAGGIGAEIVKTLAGRGSRVIILDIMPLSYPKGSFCSRSTA